jgi:hypothetical protein
LRGVGATQSHTAVQRSGYRRVPVLAYGPRDATGLCDALSSFRPCGRAYEGAHQPEAFAARRGISEPVRMCALSFSIRSTAESYATMIEEYAVKAENGQGIVVILRRGFASISEAEDHRVTMSQWKRVWIERIGTAERRGPSNLTVLNHSG